MLGEALVDLAWLLACVDVEWPSSRFRVAADLGQPALRAGTDGVRREADADPALGEALDLRQIGRDARLAKAIHAAAAVGGVEDDDLDPGRRRGVRRGERLLEAEVVKLADSRVAGREQLAVSQLVLGPDRCGGLADRLGEHRLAPGPEVGARASSAQGALERVRVGIDEAG